MRFVLVISRPLNRLWTIRAASVDGVYEVLDEVLGYRIAREDFSLIHLYGNYDVLRIGLEALAGTHPDYETAPEEVSLTYLKRTPLYLLRDHLNACLYFAQAEKLPEAQALVRRHYPQFRYENFSLEITSAPLWEFHLDTLADPQKFPFFQSLFFKGTRYGSA